MFSTFFSFELRYWLRGMMLWVFLGIISILMFLAMMFDEIQVGLAVNNTNRNAPYVVQMFYAVSTMLACLMVTAFVSSAASRDFTSDTSQLIFTKPIREFGYLMGRFWGSVLVAMIPMLGTSIGILFALPFLDTEKVGPVNLSAHLWGILGFVVPNTILVGCIVFAIATYTRKNAASFLGILGLIVCTGLANIFARNLDNETFSALVNPFGDSAFDIETQYWTVAEKNSKVLTLLGSRNLMLWNRVLWLSIAGTILTVTCWRFSFATGKARRKANKSEPAAEAAPAVARPMPEVTQDFGWTTNLRNMFGQASMDFWATVKSPVFVLVIGFGLFNTFMSLMFQTESGYGLESLPVTYNQISIIRGQLYIFLIAVTTFYAGTMVWKEREAKLDEVYDALPHATWVSFCGKLLATMAIIVLVVTSATVISMLYQLGCGYSRLQPELYFRELFVHDMVQLFAFAVAALLVHVVSPNKYVGYFGFVILIIANTFAWSGLKIQSNMVQFAEIPSYIYSDMFRFAPFADGINWFGAYWALFSVLLCFVAILLWRRGRDTGARHRLRGILPRWRGRLRVASGMAFAAWLVVAAWVYSNTQVINTYASSTEINNDLARYEKEHKADEAIPQPRVVSVKYNIEIYPKRRSLSLRGDQVIANKNDEPVDTIFVLLNDDYENEVTIEGAKLAEFDEDLGYQTWKLDQPMQPGDERSMQYTTSYEPKGFENQVSVTEVVQNGTFFNNSIAPQIGYQPGFEIQDKGERESRGLGEPTIAKPLDPENLADRRNTYISNNSDWVDVETTISTSADQIAIAPGSLQKAWEAEGRRYFQYKVDHKSLNFYSFISADYEVKRSAFEDVDVEVYYHRDHPWNVDKMVRSIKKSLEYYTTNFGPYKHKQARIIEFPRVASFAQAFPGTMPYSEGIGFIAKIDDPEDDIDMVFYVTAHEMAHQWWAHQVIGANMRGATFLSETLAQYSALMVMEKEYGRNMMRKFLGYEMNRYLRGRGSETLVERPLLEVEPNQGYIHYRKGSVVMYCLKELIGEDKLNTALRSIVDKFGYADGPYPTSIDLLNALKQQTPEKYHGTLTDMFEKITLFGNRTTEATYAEKTIDGKTKYEVTIQVECHKFHADEKGEETEADQLDEWIEIGAFASPGSKRFGKTLHRQRVHITQPENTYKFIVDEIPDRAGIDPFRLLIDRVPGDNMKKVTAE